MKLLTRRVEKPWGREALPEAFGSTGGKRVGEIWYEDPARRDLALLPKFLFTSEKLSIQVHPSADQAGTPGVHGVRAECWYIADAGPGASVGYGLRRPVTVQEVRAAAVDGSLEDLLTWHRVQAGDFIFVPSGVIHAIGANLTIVEFQQSFDVTYRLFDYGRGRPLQLDQALAVADLAPADPANFIRDHDSSDRILVSSPQFTVARVTSAAGAEWLSNRERWVVPVAGSAVGAGDQVSVGECLLLAPGEPLEIGPHSLVLVAADGPLR